MHSGQYKLCVQDESSQTRTGADFDYVMASAQGAESHFRLKSEKEWENHNGERKS